MFNLPNFRRRRAKLEPIEFVPVRHVFKPMVQIRMKVDLSGWVGDKRDRRKWAMGAGTYPIIDEDKAREFVAKGWAEFTDKPRKPLSADEIAEYDAQVTKISLGG